MSSRDNYFVAIAWQLAIEVNGNLITLIEVNLKTVVLKLSIGIVSASLLDTNPASSCQYQLM